MLSSPVELRTPIALVNARVWAGPEAGLVGDAVAFDRGTVIAVGQRSDVLRSVRSRAEVIDCRGRWVVPGFVDAHVHVRAAASVKASIDLSRVRTRREVLEAVSNAASAAHSGWLSFAGLELDDPPSSKELEAAAPRHYVRVRHRSLHAWLLNQRALVAAGVSPNATEWLTDHDGDLGRRLGRVTDAGAFERALADWSLARLAEGVTAVVDATATNARKQLELLAGWHRRGILLQRPGAFVGSPSEAARAAVPVAGVKVLVPPGADLRLELERRVRDAWAARLPAAVHCPDLETLGALLDVLEHAGGRRGRVRIEHASLCPPDWLSVVARLGAAVVTHPGFVYAHGDRYLDDRSLEPHGWLYRLQSWRRFRVPLAVGSDAPAGPADPLLAWRAAITRRTATGRRLGWQERLSWSDGLAAITAWAADLSGLRDSGRLRAGGRAAAVVLAGRPCESVSRGGVRPVVVVNGTSILHRL